MNNVISNDYHKFCLHSKFLKRGNSCGIVGCGRLRFNMMQGLFWVIHSSHKKKVVE